MARKKNAKGAKPNSKGTKKRTKRIRQIIIKRWWIGPVILILTGIGLFAFFLRSLPSPKLLSEFPYPESTEIFDRNDNLLYEIHGEENRVPINLKDLPDHLIDATLAIEDEKFYRHSGFDLKGISRAVVSIFLERKLEGGSTITQQLVKNALLTQERTITRKFKEAVLTILTEQVYTKDEILEMYFNQIPYGGVSYGIEAGARRFFNKSAKDLSLAESALLAGLPAAPTNYSPFIHPDKAKQRQKTVLYRMKQAGKIDQETYDKLKDEKLSYAKPESKINAPHFVFYIKEQLIEKYGEKITHQGGLKVKTTLDLEIQNMAEEIVKDEISKLADANVSNGAVIITEPKTGQILAMVGSKNYFAQDIDGQYNVTTGLRQPGSAIKPINYVTGLATKKVTPATIFADIPTCFTGGPKTYCPRNYDGSFHGAVQLRYALGNSFNIPAVRMLAINGIEPFIASASAAGLESLGKRDPSDFGLSLTLGGGEVKMTEMATAFGTLANLGVKKDLGSILKVEDKKGETLEEFVNPGGKRVFPMEAAYLINHILQDNGARSAAFGSNSLLVIKDHPEVAVKTGTTNDKRDNWTVGYTPGYVAVVWVGNNDNSPMGWVSSGVTGASPIWNKIMTNLLEGKKQQWPTQPTSIVGATVCNATGARPPEEGCDSRYEYFIKDTVPSTQSINQPILIDKDTDMPVQPGEDLPSAEWQERQAVKDPLGTIVCFDCPQTIPEKPVTVSP
jgi:1A family penicillin-binding protein